MERSVGCRLDTNASALSLSAFKEERHGFGCKEEEVQWNRWEKRDSTLCDVLHTWLCVFKMAVSFVCLWTWLWLADGTGCTNIKITDAKRWAWPVAVMLTGCLRCSERVVILLCPTNKDESFPTLLCLLSHHLCVNKSCQQDMTQIIWTALWTASFVWILYVFYLKTSLKTTSRFSFTFHKTHFVMGLRLCWEVEGFIIILSSLH